LKAWGDVLPKQGNAKDALAKHDEALKYAPNWKELKDVREALAKCAGYFGFPKAADQIRSPLPFIFNFPDKSAGYIYYLDSIEGRSPPETCAPRIAPAHPLIDSINCNSCHPTCESARYSRRCRIVLLPLVVTISRHGWMGGTK
jgi:hypothetical protein